MSRSASSKCPAFIAHAFYLLYLRKIVEDTVEDFNSAWLLPPQQDKLFKSAKDYLRRF